MAAKARSVLRTVPFKSIGQIMTSALLRATLDLLDQTALEDWKRLAEECGLTVAWIRQLVDGKIKEPGVNKVERLYNALSGKAVNL